MLVAGFARRGPGSKQPEHGFEPISTGRPEQPGDAGPDRRLPGATGPAAGAGHGHLLLASPADIRGAGWEHAADRHPPDQHRRLRLVGLCGTALGQYSVLAHHVRLHRQPALQHDYRATGPRARRNRRRGFPRQPAGREHPQKPGAAGGGNHRHPGLWKPKRRTCRPNRRNTRRLMGTAPIMSAWTRRSLAPPLCPRSAAALIRSRKRRC